MHPSPAEQASQLLEMEMLRISKRAAQAVPLGEIEQPLLRHIVDEVEQTIRDAFGRVGLGSFSPSVVD